MSNLALLLIGLALPFIAAGLIGAALYLRSRRRRAFAHLHGLYLESQDCSPLDYGTSMAAALGASVGPPDGHVCSFGDNCDYTRRENERRATATRINGGQS